MGKQISQLGSRRFRRREAGPRDAMAAVHVRATEERKALPPAVVFEAVASPPKW